MEENTTMTEQTQAENMGNETEAQGTAQAAATQEKEPKLFTQEEVNGFVQSRVSRLKGQLSKEISEEYNQKLADLKSRESRLMVKEALIDRNMPRELVDIITCADETDLNKKLDALQEIYGNKNKEDEKSLGFVQLGASNSGTTGQGTDPVRRAMGLDRKE